MSRLPKSPILYVATLLAAQIADTCGCGLESQTTGSHPQNGGSSQSANFEPVATSDETFGDPSPTPGADESGQSSVDDGKLPPTLWTRTTGQDWPKFLGPTGDSKSTERGILTKWPVEGPRMVWQRRLGDGYGIGSVSRGRYLQFDRVDDKARLVALNAETGAELWTFEYSTEYEDLYGYSGGPRASPVIDGDRVYIYGVEGMLHCLKLEDGSLIWKLDTAERFGVIQNFFGVGSTPVVFEDLLLVMVGGSPPEDKEVPPGRLDRVSPNGTAIVALDKLTGDVRYQVGDELASYSSLKVAKINGKPTCLAFCRGGLMAVSPRTGEISFHFPWRARILESVNASTPVVSGSQVFISETYSIGSAMLDLAQKPPEVVWKDETSRREKSFKAHWNTPILIDGYLYGCSGRNSPDAELRCIQWRTGQVQWSEPNLNHTSLLYVDGHFVCQEEYGSLMLVKVNPQKLEIVAQVKLRDQQASDVPVPGIGASGLLQFPCWAAPILSHGLLYVRGKNQLVCLELIPEKK